MDLMAFAHSLSSRLLDPKNEQLRDAVRELDFRQFHGKHLRDMEKRLVALVDVLPNLQRVKYELRASLSGGVYDANWTIIVGSGAS